jgi:predicted transcriptional regulator
LILAGNTGTPWTNGEDEEVRQSDDTYVKYAEVENVTDYLNAAGESVTDFAQRVGVSRMQVYRLINGEGVSLDMIDRVSAATNGAVSAAAIVAARSTANEAVK